MLVLTRKRGEIIRIGDNAAVKILSFDDHQVRVGIAAPRELEVYRIEIFDRIQRERLALESQR